MKKTTTEEVRQKAIEMRKQGAKLREIYAELKEYSQSAIYRIVSPYKVEVINKKEFYKVQSENRTLKRKLKAINEIATKGENDEQ